MSKKSIYAHDHVPAGKSMTKQDGAQTPADVYRRFVQGVPLPEAPPPVYADLSEFDYAAAREQVANFKSAFEELGAHVREHFGNDDAEYLNFLQENEERIDSDGLSAVLKAELESPAGDPLPKDEETTEGVSGGEATKVAQKGATDDESGTQKTS